MVLITAIQAPEEGLVYTTNNVQLKIGEKTVGSGILYISQSALSWQPDAMNDGMSVLWKQISVHGISTQPGKCIYFIVDHEVEWPGVYELRGLNGNVENGVAAVPPGEPMEAQAADAANNDAQDDDDVDEGNVTDEEDAENAMTECWLIPTDINAVDIIFRAMSDCQALHPDPDDSISEESDFMDESDGEEDPLFGAFYVPQEHNAGADHNNDDDDADGAQGGMRNLNLNDNRFVDADF